MRSFFELTPAAAAALRNALKGLPEIECPIFAPVRDARDSAKKKWGVGIYDRKNLSVKDPVIVYVDGLEFYIDPSMADALSGQTLSYVDGAFMST